MSPHFGMVQETLVRSVYARQRHACAREAPQDSSLGGTVRVGVFRGKGGRGCPDRSGSPRFPPRGSARRDQTDCGEGLSLVCRVGCGPDVPSSSTRSLRGARRAVGVDREHRQRTGAVVGDHQESVGPIDRQMHGILSAHLLLIEPGQATALRVDDERRCVRPPPVDRVEKTLAPVKSEKRGGSRGLRRVARATNGPRPGPLGRR